MPGKRRPRRRRGLPSRPRGDVEDRGEIIDLAAEVARHRESSPMLSGGDLDADWHSAYATGEEGVGGSVATPDQDVVDEIGRALGVEQEADAPVRMSDEILKARDRLRWHLERDAADEEEGRSRRRSA